MFNFSSIMTPQEQDDLIDRLVFDRMYDQDYVSFDGDEWCEDCSGWNGVDRRCECGNRRLTWELRAYRSDMGITFFVEPEAY